MNDLSFWRNNLIQLQSLLELAKGDPVAEFQLKNRIEFAESMIQSEKLQTGTLFPKENIEKPRAALFLASKSSELSDGIKPSLASAAISSYESLFVEFAVHDERVEARKAGKQRRSKGSLEPSLLFVGTPRGSFGLEFVVADTTDTEIAEIRSQSLRNVAGCVSALANSCGVDEDFGKVVESIPDKAMPHLKRLFSILSSNKAEIRFAFPNQESTAIDLEKINRASSKLDKEINTVESRFFGRLLGVTPESGYFDFKIDDREVISGRLSDTMSDDEIELMVNSVNKFCHAEFKITEIIKVAGAPIKKYLMLSVRAVPDAD